MGKSFVHFGIKRSQYIAVYNFMDFGNILHVEKYINTIQTYTHKLGSVNNKFYLKILLQQR